MAMSPELKAINSRISKIGNGERSFKEEMAALSRELLPYVLKEGDIDAVNRLLDALNQKNREQAKKFYSKMLPWTYNNTEKRFGGKSKNKDMVSKRTQEVHSFLKDPAANIWTWLAKTAEPVERPARAKNYSDKVASIVEDALTDAKETDRIDPKTVFISAVKAMVHSGMKLSDIFATFEDAIKDAEKEMKAATDAPQTNANSNAEAPAPQKKAA